MPKALQTRKKTSFTKERFLLRIAVCLPSSQNIKEDLSSRKTEDFKKTFCFSLVHNENVRLKNWTITVWIVKEVFYEQRNQNKSKQTCKNDKRTKKRQAFLPSIFSHLIIMLLNILKIYCACFPLEIQPLFHGLTKQHML